MEQSTLEVTALIVLHDMPAVHKDSKMFQMFGATHPEHLQ